MNRLLKAYLRLRPFSENEAWLIFKLAAYSEAAGWTLLISGVLIGKYLTPHSTIAVQIAGHMHGTLFILYIAITIVVAPSMRWKPLRILSAGLVSIPPYGTLIFEMWESHRRQSLRRQFLMSNCLYRLAVN